MTTHDFLLELLEVLMDDTALDDLTRRRLEDLAQDIFDSD